LRRRVVHTKKNPLAQEALEVGVLSTSRRVKGNEHPGTLNVMTNLAATYGKQGKLAEAEALLEETLATSRRVLGAGHPDTLSAARNLAIAHSKLGKDAEAEELRALYSCE